MTTHPFRTGTEDAPWPILGPALALACGAALLTFPASRAEAAAFDGCPTEAFLTQGSRPRTYAIDLVTGDHTVAAATHGTKKPLNAMGFNPNDRFLYGWSKQSNEPVRVHADGRMEALGDINVTGTHYYAGDVSAASNTYFVYRRGSAHGLYAIDLDPRSPAHLRMERIVDGGTLNLGIYDFAFHPVTDDAYAVDRRGDLFAIDPVDGDATRLGNIGRTGTFGAAYFDASGDLYVGRNADGQLFRIDVDSGDYAAEPFAVGPASSSNDGSRCAAALLADDATEADFGDAPASYATALADNGPRHGDARDAALFLGSGVDGEGDGYAHPLSDDATGTGDSDDGVSFVSPLTAGDSVLAVVRSSAAGYLGGWIDLDRNGRFDPQDRLIADRAVRAGDNPVSFVLPTSLDPGRTWARFRLSSAPGLEATGGAPDGEVEDVQLTLLPAPIALEFYPSESDWATVAFEDSWPFAGDYDMNDLVVHLRTTTHRSSAGLVRIDIEGELAAVGASYHNGFGIALPGVSRDDVDEAGIEFTIDGEPVTDRSALEPGRRQAILIVDEDMRQYAAEGEGCLFFRTESGCGADIPMSFRLSVPFAAPLDVPLGEVFDPFLFATPGRFHGARFAAPPGRSYEIHLKNRAPTEAFDPRLFAGVGQDASLPSQGLYFQSANGMPWALAIGRRWKHPVEYGDISDAYPLFVDYSVSGGASSRAWHDPATARSELLFRD